MTRRLTIYRHVPLSHRNSVPSVYRSISNLLQIFSFYFTMHDLILIRRWASHSTCSDINRAVLHSTDIFSYLSDKIKRHDSFRGTVVFRDRWEIYSLNWTLYFFFFLEGLTILWIFIMIRVRRWMNRRWFVKCDRTTRWNFLESRITGDCNFSKGATTSVDGTSSIYSAVKGDQLRRIPADELHTLGAIRVAPDI